MTVLILDGCREFVSNAPLTKHEHGLKMRNPGKGRKLKEARDTLVAHACAPSAEAADTGEGTTEKKSIVILIGSRFSILFQGCIVENLCSTC